MEKSTSNVVYEGPCKPVSESPVIVVPCKAVRTLTYTIDITSTEADRFLIPYAVAINGEVRPEFAEQSKSAAAVPAKYNKDPKLNRATKPAEITVPAQTGDTVTLYLNSDAAPAWRTTPLYSVTLGERSAVVRITEKMGKHHDRPTPVLVPGTKGEKDEYTASLTGDIWMSASHMYRSIEVDSEMPEETRAEVVNAIKRIYDGLSAPRMQITDPARGEHAAYTLNVTFQDSDNPKDNINWYNLLRDGVTRVHPAGYAALFNAAIDNGVNSIVVTSCWRPLLGSIVHRLGMGLDVNYVGDVRLNREELRTGKPKSKDADENVSEDEVLLFKELRSAELEEKEAEKEARRLVNSLDSEAKEQATVRVMNAEKARFNTAKKWNDERDKHEPPKVKAFRSTLLQCRCVGQLFDPWYMYIDTSAPGLPNMQRTQNETLHSHHLHITVKDRMIFTP